MPSVLPKVIAGSKNFESALNYYLYINDDSLKLSKMFVTELIEANNTLPRPELKKLIERKTTNFLLNVKFILEELF